MQNFAKIQFAIFVTAKTALKAKSIENQQSRSPLIHKELRLSESCCSHSIVAEYFIISGHFVDPIRVIF